MHPRRDAGCLQTCGNLAGSRGDGRPLLRPQHLQPPQDGVAGSRVQVLEGQLLQLLGDAVHADGAGERRVDVQRLTRNPLPLLGLGDVVERAHVVQAVRQFDHQHTDVLGDGQDEAAQVLGLTRVIAVHLQAGELGDAFNQLRHLLAEAFGDVGAGGDRVLDHVMEHGGDNGGGVEPVVGQDARHLDRVGEVGIARGPELTAVHPHGINVGTVKQGLVGHRVIALDPLDKLVLAKEPGLARRSPGWSGHEAWRRRLGGRSAVPDRLRCRETDPAGVQ